MLRKAVILKKKLFPNHFFSFSFKIFDNARVSAKLKFKESKCLRVKLTISGKKGFVRERDIGYLKKYIA